MQSEGLLPHLFARPSIGKVFKDVVLAAPSACLVGGAVRDTWLTIGALPNDLDIVVANEQYDEVVHHLQEKAYEYTENRHGNARFILDAPDTAEGFHVDIWSPFRFFTGFSNITSMLSNFDLSINAVGIYLLSGDTIDPVDGFTDLENRVTRLLPTQWETDDLEALAYLIKRLNDFLDRFPDVRVLNPEIAFTKIEQVEQANKQADLVDPFSLKYVPVKVSGPIQMHSISWAPHAEDELPPTTGAVGMYQFMQGSWKDYKLTPKPAIELKGSWQEDPLPELEEEKSEEDVCAMWLAGDRCPGCTGCPFEGPPGKFV